MTDTTTQLESMADQLWQAQKTRQPCAPLTAERPEMTLAEAYHIQTHNVRRRLKDGGFDGQPVRRIGHKIGLTSRAIQQWLGVDEPDFGILFDDMAVPDAGQASMAHLLQPRAEVEVAFVLDADLKGPGLTVADVIAASAFVLPAIEIMDSRIRDWAIRGPDTVADNASAGVFALGSKPQKLDAATLRLAGVILRKNGRVVSTGTALACLGHPINALAWLANALAAWDESLKAGDIILSGALGPAVAVQEGDWVQAEIAHLGSVQFTVGP